MQVRVEGENVIVRATATALANKKQDLPAFSPGNDNRLFVILGAGLHITLAQLNL